MKITFRNHLAGFSATLLLSLITAAAEKAPQVTKASEAGAQVEASAVHKLQGPGSSGGGNALICFKTAKTVQDIRKNGGYVSDEFLSQINFIETFDLYEAKKPRGFNEISDGANKIIQIKDQETIAEYAKRIISRLKIHYPYLTADLMQEFEMLSSQRTIMTDDRIDQVYDVNSGDYVDKQNCMYATLAAQSNSNSMTTVYVDKKLFNHPLNSRLSKGVLMVHEVVYSLMRKTYKHTDSARTRFLVAALINENTLTRDIDIILNGAGVYAVINNSSEYWARYGIFKRISDLYFSPSDIWPQDRRKQIEVLDSKTIPYSGTNKELCYMAKKATTAENVKSLFQPTESYIKQSYLDDLRKNLLIEDITGVLNLIKEKTSLELNHEKTFDCKKNEDNLYVGSWTYDLQFDIDVVISWINASGQMKLPLN